MSDLIRMDLKIYLDKKDMEVLTKEAEKHREQQKARGQAPNWTEKDELIYGVQKRLNELKIRHGEEVCDATHSRDFEQAAAVTREIRGRMYCRQMVRSSDGV